MLIGEYDYEMDMQEKQEGLLSVKEAAEEMGVSEETFLNN